MSIEAAVARHIGKMEEYMRGGIPLFYGRPAPWWYNIPGAVLVIGIVAAIITAVAR